MTPRQAVAKWERELKKMKAKTEKESKKANWTGRQRSIIFSKRSSKLAKLIAKEVGMKSMGEVKCAADMAKRGVKFSYETETFAYQHKPQKYTPDFVIPRKGRKNLYIEYKGKMTPDIRRKMIAIQASNPNLEIAIVFENAKNNITKRRKKKDGTYNTPTKYWQWAERKGFLWSEHTIKEEWL